MQGFERKQEHRRLQVLFAQFETGVKGHAVDRAGLCLEIAIGGGEIPCSDGGYGYNCFP